MTALAGVLMIIAATIFSSLLSSVAKSNVITEVRQNGDLVISLFDRDVRAATSASATSTTTTLTGVSGTITWSCQTVGGIRQFTRNGQAVTNIDPALGVQVLQLDGVAGCNVFTITSGTPRIVTLRFRLIQGSQVTGRDEYEIDVPFRVSVGTRQY